MDTDQRSSPSLLMSVIILALLGVGATAFLPTVVVHTPVLGNRSWSPADLGRAAADHVLLPSSKRSRLSLKQDFFDLVKELTREQDGGGSSWREAVFFWGAVLIPVSLAAAYLCALIGLVAGLAGRPSRVWQGSLGTALFCSVYALAGVFCTGYLARARFQQSVEHVSDQFLGLITKNFVQETTLYPGSGLILMAVLVLVAYAGTLVYAVRHDD